MLITVLTLFLFSQLIYIVLRRYNSSIRVLSDFYSFYILIFFLVLFFFKNIEFGADTNNYLEEFNEYCASPATYHGIDYTYKFAFELLNFVIAGTCEVKWLIWAWPISVIFACSVTVYIFKINGLFIIAVFSSFIGIELLTNAMRQGLSIAILLLAFGFYLSGRFFYFVIFAFLAFLFHQASILIISILLLSKINYKLVIPMLFITVYLLLGTSFLDVLPGSTEVKAVIYKYLPHAKEDIIIRILSMLNLLCTIVIYFVIMRRLNTKDKKTYNLIFNLIAICLLLSLIPYLGFRVIYGIYPLLLLLTYFSVKKHCTDAYLYLSLIVCVNTTLTILWLCGSSHMRQISFVSFI